MRHWHRNLQFFKNEVDDIVSGFQDSKDTSSGYVELGAHSGLCLDEVVKLCKMKCSTLDILPQADFLSVWSVMINAICKLLNTSLASCVFPSIYKESHITPLLKFSLLVVSSIVGRI